MVDEIPIIIYYKLLPSSYISPLAYSSNYGTTGYD